jgi:hypothetical protein
MPCQTEANVCAWIDAFFFRASAMVLANKCMVLHMEQGVPLTTISQSNQSTLSGTVDYTAIVTDEQIAGKSVSVYLSLANCFA